MGRQRNVVQMKQQTKIPEKELNKMEIENLSDAEFKTLVIRMLKELSEDLNRIKKIQSETKDTLIERKNNLQGNNSSVDKTKSQINDLEHKEAKNNQLEQDENRIQKNKDSISNPWYNIKHPNIFIIRVPKREKKEKEIGNLLEKIMKENFLNLVKEIDM